MALVIAEGNTLTEEVKADEKGSQLKGTIEKALLRKFLVPAEVYAENVPNSTSSIAATLIDPGLASAMLDVMCALLSKTEAWAVLDKEEVKVDHDSLCLVKPALIALGLKSEVAENFGRKRFWIHISARSSRTLESSCHIYSIT